MIIRVCNYGFILGVKSVDFESTRIKKADFSASIQDITLHSTGLKRVEFSGIVVLQYLKQRNVHGLIFFSISGFVINSGPGNCGSHSTHF